MFRHEDVTRVLLDHETFSNAVSQHLSASNGMNPPEHTAFQDQTNGIVRVLPGSYEYYPEWVWFDSPTTGTYRLPAPHNASGINFVMDEEPSYQGIIRTALSPDGNEAELEAKFRGVMREDATSRTLRPSQSSPWDKP